VKISVIAVDYEHHVSRDRMREGITSLINQTFNDFELLVVHDGKKETSYENEFDFTQFKNPVKFLNTSTRMNNWGHSSRDLGMRNASGDYYLQFNIDNILYETALEEITVGIDRYNNPDIIIFEILHREFPGRVFEGFPVVNYIDCLQLVAKAEVWEKNGYWHDKSYGGDGYMYQTMCKSHDYVHLSRLLGENR
jgi:glycosyltransferase involved in cell wall biosynthesis